MLEDEGLELSVLHVFDELKTVVPDTVFGYGQYASFFGKLRVWLLIFLLPLPHKTSWNMP